MMQTGRPQDPSPAGMAGAVLSPAACHSVAGFVRDALGCACPPAVFEDVRLDPAPAAFAGAPGARLLAIGGRLLVLLAEAGDGGPRQAELAALLRRGRELRDAGGFNRFRLVLVTPPGTAEQAACAVDPQAVVPRDGRLHLHVVAQDALPPVLCLPAPPP